MRPHSDPLAAHIHTLPGEWQAALQLVHALQRLPATARGCWAGSADGHIVIDARLRPHYHVQEMWWRHLHLRSALILEPSLLSEAPFQCWAIVGCWFDHWIGAGGGPGPWLSEGGTPGSALSVDAAQLLQASFARGYFQAAIPQLLSHVEAHLGESSSAPSRWLEGLIEGEAPSPTSRERRRHFAIAFALARLAPQQLMIADPHLARWFQTTILYEPWWRHITQEEPMTTPSKQSSPKTRKQMQTPEAPEAKPPVRPKAGGQTPDESGDDQKPDGLSRGSG